MKNIVVGTDLTERAGDAVKLAFDVAEAFGATLHLTTACGAPVLAVHTEVVAMPRHEDVIAGATTELKGLAADAAARGITTQVHALSGEPSEVLCRVASQVDADLVVVGNRRMHGAARLLGSVANRVAHRAPCNVLIADTDHK